mmetsp:Transcript_11671/g.17683  ORF Transcript_11671/g.17683 Transcript_11671/m.17683 type:complete len:414 (+) Transcript_11671:105-1346(+)
MIDDSVVDTNSKSATCVFVKKLFDMVEGSSDVISWVAEGTAFEVKDPKRLESEVLPVFFRHCRFQSLVRQLNFYAFKKVSKERSSWVYSHEYFRRDRPDLLDRMRRKTNNLCAKRNRRERSSKNKKRQFTPSSMCSSDDSSEESCDNEYAMTNTTYHLLSMNQPRPSEGGSWNSPGGYNGSGSSCDSEELHSDDDVDYEEVLGSWDTVHHFFLSGSAGQENSSLGDHVGNSNSVVQVLRANETDMDAKESAQAAYQQHLLKFCLSRNPWQDTQALFADIHGLLSDHADMTSELNAYASALAPPPTRPALSTLLSACVQLEAQSTVKEESTSTDKSTKFSPLTNGTPGESTIPCILQANEITLVRTFIAFALACLHDACHSELVVVSPEVSEGAFKSVLGMCVDNWSSYAKICT